MNPRCSAPELQMALLDEIREGRESSPDLAAHLEECGACQVAAERLRRMAEVWTGDEVDHDVVALAEAKFQAKKHSARPPLGWFDVVPFASAGVAAGCLLLMATGTIDVPWTSPSAKTPARGGAEGHVATAHDSSRNDAPRVAPTFASTDESAKKVRSRPHIETSRGVAPLVHGLRLELRRGESAKVALNTGQSSTVEGPCLVEFWSAPTEVGGWRIVREDAPPHDDHAQVGRGHAESAAGIEPAGRDVPAGAADNAARAEGSATAEGTAETSPRGAEPRGVRNGGAAPSAAAETSRARPESAGAGSAASPTKNGATTREGSAATALNETVASETQSEGRSVNLGSVRAWSRAAAALREDDFEGADRAFDELGKSGDPATRDAARLARAQLWISRGRERDVVPVLEQLAQHGSTALVRRRATDLLYRDVH